MAKKRKIDAGLEELEKPLPPLKIGALMDDDAVAEVLAERSYIEGQKLILLLKQYGLELGDYRGLSLALARELYNGFKEAKPKGRPTKWTDLVLMSLFVEVERKRIERGLRENNSEIYDAVAKQAPWDSFLESVEGVHIAPDPGEAIRQAYFKAKKNNWSRIAWDAYRWHEETDSVDEWEKLVLSAVQ